MKFKVIFIFVLILATACSHSRTRARPSKDSKEVYGLLPTEFIEANGTKYAYRKFGKKSEFPLVFFQHFRGTMDNWDPLLLNLIAQERTVIVFDNKGVSSTNGKTPDTFRAMARDAADFIKAMGYKQVDVLGFSIGGAVAQELMINHEELVHRAILAATAPEGGEGLNKRNPAYVAITKKPNIELKDFLITFFEKSPASQKLGSEYLERRSEKKVTPELPSSRETMIAQDAARKAWGDATDKEFPRLKKMKHKILVAGGSNDIMMPTINSFLLFKHLPDARLILYPDSATGFLFQYPELFARDVNTFLDE